MVDAAGEWAVESAVEPEVAHALFGEDRIANAYALADLEPPFASHTTVAVARRGVVASACLVLRYPTFSALVTHGDPAGVAAILAEIDLPPSMHIQVRDVHLPALERRCRLHDPHEMQRMALTAATFRPAEGRPANLVRLNKGDTPALLDLYRAYAGNFFQAEQLAGGVFYGVRDGGRLVAAGGTHVVAPRAALAAVGNIFTLPEARGRGLATTVTSAITAELLARGCRDVCLNVAPGNGPAVTVYQRLGYRPHNRYWEGEAIRKEGEAGVGEEISRNDVAPTGAD